MQVVDADDVIGGIAAVVEPDSLTVEARLERPKDEVLEISGERVYVDGEAVCPGARIQRIGASAFDDGIERVRVIDIVAQAAFEGIGGPFIPESVAVVCSVQRIVTVAAY